MIHQTMTGNKVPMMEFVGDSCVHRPGCHLHGLDIEMNLIPEIGVLKEGCFCERDEKRMLGLELIKLAIFRGEATWVIIAF